MLTRIRIEVEGEDSAAATEEALTKYEHGITYMEATRCQLGKGGDPAGWRRDLSEIPSYAEEFGREVTDEVIEYDASLPGYKGRRVVQFRRLDTRSSGLREAPAPPPGSISFAAPEKEAA